MPLLPVSIVNMFKAKQQGQHLESHLVWAHVEALMVLHLVWAVSHYPETVPSSEVIENQKVQDGMFWPGKAKLRACLGM